MAISDTDTPNDQSDLYIAVEEDGLVVTAREHANSDNSNKKLYCPKCLQDEGNHVPVKLDTTSLRYRHLTGAEHTCWRDGRHNDRHHPEIAQTVFAKLANNFETKNAEIEYTSIKSCDYDVAAKTPWNDLEGIVVEVQHQCGGFTTRFHRKVMNAHRAGYGVHVVFSPNPRGKQWFTQVIEDHMGSDARIGQYCDDDLQLGTIIHPDEMHYRKFYNTD
ncbi:hypothetical protein [Natrinema sp. DC36]|uniref:hypothetical protein n=1 Tax=Natrinema sp. DC36 TaxID=2878680 RepID=UPI001CEFFBCE|nr:hypothetical protein [Natrinema sp. DC36]